MRTCIVSLKSAAPYSQSKVLRMLKKDKERPDEYEERVWRERCHYIDDTPDSHIMIPPMAFKNCLQEAAKYLAIQIPGKGKATFTKHFEAGVMVTDGLVLPETRETVKGEWLFLNADGRRGGGKRVWKCYPVFAQWKGDVTFHVLDDTVTREVFEQHLDQAGRFVGIGRFRPRNGGYYGRFEVVQTRWEE